MMKRKCMILFLAFLGCLNPEGASAEPDRLVRDQRNFTRLTFSGSSEGGEFHVDGLYLHGRNDLELNVYHKGEYAAEAKDLEGNVLYRDFKNESISLGLQSHWSLIAQAYAGRDSANLDFELDVPHTAIFLDVYRFMGGKWTLLKHLVIPAEIIRDQAKEIPSDAVKGDFAAFKKSLENNLQKLQGAVDKKDLALGKSIVDHDLKGLISGQTTADFPRPTLLLTGKDEMLKVIQLASYRLEEAKPVDSVPKCKSVADLGVTMENFPKLEQAAQASVVRWWVKEKSPGAASFLIGSNSALEGNQFIGTVEGAGFHNHQYDQTKRQFYLSFNPFSCMLGAQKFSIHSWATFQDKEGRRVREHRDFMLNSEKGPWDIQSVGKPVLEAIGEPLNSKQLPSGAIDSFGNLVIKGAGSK